MHPNVTRLPTSKPSPELTLKRAYGIVFASIREKTGESLEEFGQRFPGKLSGTTIRSWEHGKYDELSFVDWPEKRKQYADIGGISVLQLDTLADSIAEKLAPTDIKQQISDLLTSNNLPAHDRGISSRINDAILDSTKVNSRA